MLAFGGPTLALEADTWVLVADAVRLEGVLGFQICVIGELGLEGLLVFQICVIGELGLEGLLGFQICVIGELGLEGLLGFQICVIGELRPETIGPCPAVVALRDTGVVLIFPLPTLLAEAGIRTLDLEAGPLEE